MIRSQSYPLTGERSAGGAAAPLESALAPFATIESAQQFMALLDAAVADAQQEIDEPTSADTPEAARRQEALYLVAYKLRQLRAHVGSSRRLLNDLRTLRRLLLGERAMDIN